MGVDRVGRTHPTAVDAGLVVLSAVIWAISVYLNNEVFFPWTHDEDYLHWIFVPGGIKVLLVMLLGWRAVVGMAFGAIPGVLTALPGIGPLALALVAGAVGVMPWLSIRLFSYVTGVRHPWHDLVWWHLPAIAALSAFANSAFLNSQLILLGLEPPRDLPVNLLSVMISDFAGALILLLVSVALVRLLRTIR
ncbi:hypothetical protein EDC65_1901 [Stella humosa]|uniref:MASE1 protein n=1 Tax=Stella humosa TaxID=94 RepID=A0A3N1MAL9_9PROT|nr:hypothetical protein [Stella humosa]ROQ00105.1 hypothetical protein EDC65_1901 [Stella humosa]BBK30660.1 hypothetical protein STHU_12940 [Stella humosa]